jgi:hypothetical protein
VSPWKSNVLFIGVAVAVPAPVLSLIRWSHPDSTACHITSAVVDPEGNTIALAEVARGTEDSLP